MEPQFILLSGFRLPDYPNAALKLNGSPLNIIDPSSLTPGNPSKSITPAIGLATVLYKWHPSALAAFLDLDAWFSLTWTLSIAEGTPEGSKIEIGRIGKQITFGSLDSSGDNWTLMLTYNIVLEGDDRGKWIPNPRESMLGEQDVTDPNEIERLGREFAEKIVTEKRWETGKKMKHQFFVEYAPMDVWGDGIAMSPHWLYSSLDLSKCTACKETGGSLQRCGRCGTSTYCSDVCQKGDWAVHKNVCSMSMEDRGQAIKLSEKGGLIKWDVTKTYANEEGEVSTNPNFEMPQLKRRRTEIADSIEKSG
jgi:hypothetical protein